MVMYRKFGLHKAGPFIRVPLPKPAPAPAPAPKPEAPPAPARPVRLNPFEEVHVTLPMAESAPVHPPAPRRGISKEDFMKAFRSS